MLGSYSTKIRALFFSVGLAMLVVGCGGDNGTSPPPEGPTLAQAWKAFESGDYASAISVFHSVLSDDPTLTEGFTGLGWSFAFDCRLDSAVVYLDVAVGLDSTAVDALTILSAVLLAQDDREGAIERALLALDEDADWSFDHCPGADYLDLHLILAEAYYGQGESSFALAQAQADILDPDNGLDPGNPETWEGQPSYAAALLMIIQRIEEEVGADLVL